MKNPIPVIFVLGVASILGGCPSEPPPPPQAAQPTPTPTPTPVQPPPEPVITPITGSIKVPGLIPPTNPQQQKAQVVTGRADPFSIIAVQPRLIRDPDKTKNAAAGVGDNTGGQSSAGKPLTSGLALPPPPPNNGSGAVSDPDQVATPPEPPLPPQPTEAQQVEVSGIIQFPTTAVAIVQAPGERTERSVSAGARLANGQILVKAIYANPENPIVILEQYGIEVTKKLGKAAPPPAPPVS